MTENKQVENLDVKLEEVNKEIDNLVARGEQDEKTKKKLRGKIRWKNVTILVLIIIIIILLLRSCGTENTINLIPDIETGDLIEKVDEKAEQRFIDIPVLASFTVTKTNPCVDLSNPASNADKFYLLYEFYLEGETEPFYTSKHVAPDTAFSADIYNALGDKKGSYYATVKVKTYEFGTLEECNGVSNDVLITVK